MLGLVTRGEFKALKDEAMGVIRKSLSSIDKDVDRELEQIGKKISRLVTDSEAKLELELSELRRQRAEMEHELRLIEKRSELATERLFDIEGRVAAVEGILEKAHRFVTYVPENPFAALSEGDVEKMEGVSQKVRENLEAIRSLQDDINGASNPGMEPLGGF